MIMNEREERKIRRRLERRQRFYILKHFDPRFFDMASDAES